MCRICVCLCVLNVYGMYKSLKIKWMMKEQITHYRSDRIFPPEELWINLKIKKSCDSKHLKIDFFWQLGN